MRDRTVTATVNPGLIKRSSLFFNNSIFSIMRELVQNSRRAGATKVYIQRDTVRNLWLYADNGKGCKSRDLLEMGGSNWEEHIRKSETPAGLGFFALSRRNPKVASPVNGWKLNLTQDNFCGLTLEEEDYDPLKQSSWEHEAGFWPPGFTCEFDYLDADRDAIGRGIYTPQEFWEPLTNYSGMTTEVLGKTYEGNARFLSITGAAVLRTVTVSPIPGITMQLSVARRTSEQGPPDVLVLLAGASYNRISLPSDYPAYGPFRFFARIQVDREALLPLELPQRNTFIQSENLALVQKAYRHHTLDLYAKVVEEGHSMVPLDVWEAALAHGYTGSIALPCLLGKAREGYELTPDAPLVWSRNTPILEPVYITDDTCGPVIPIEDDYHDFLHHLPVDLIWLEDWVSLTLRHRKDNLQEYYPLLHERFPLWFGHLRSKLDWLTEFPELKLVIIGENQERQEVIIHEDMASSDFWGEFTGARVVESITLEKGSDRLLDSPVDTLWQTTDTYDLVNRDWQVTRDWLKEADPEHFVYSLYERFLEHSSDDDEEEIRSAAATLVSDLLAAQGGDVEDWVLGQLTSRFSGLYYDLPRLPDILEKKKLVITMVDQVVEIDFLPKE